MICSSDTCRETGAKCPANSRCVNKVDGTFSCVCDPEYYSSSGECVLRKVSEPPLLITFQMRFLSDPCFASTVSVCDVNAWCDPGNATVLTAAYKCNCMLPYVGDGKTCHLAQGQTEKPPCLKDQYRCPSDGSCVPIPWVSLAL